MLEPLIEISDTISVRFIEEKFEDFLGKKKRFRYYHSAQNSSMLDNHYLNYVRPGKFFGFFECPFVDVAIDMFEIYAKEEDYSDMIKNTRNFLVVSFPNSYSSIDCAFFVNDMQEFIRFVKYAQMASIQRM